MEFIRGKTANKLLAGLSDDDALLLKPSLSLVELPVRKLMESRNRRIEFVYFLEGGLASMVATGGSNHSVEVAIIGVLVIALMGAVLTTGLGSTANLTARGITANAPNYFAVGGGLSIAMLIIRLFLEIPNLSRVSVKQRW